MNQKELFSFIAHHLLKQGRRANGVHPSNRYLAMPPTSCMLRTPEGLTCAVGCLVPAERYFPELEDHSDMEEALIYDDEEGAVDDNPFYQDLRDIIWEAHGVDLFDPDTQQLLSGMQLLHDNKSPESWRAHLINKALTLGYNPAEVLP